MAKHTAAPWNYAEGNPSITCIRNGTEHTIATVGISTLAWHKDYVSAAREAEANARLIAAAPELLEALEELVVKIDYYKNLVQNTRKPLLQQELFNAKMLIAKTKGY